MSDRTAPRRGPIVSFSVRRVSALVLRYVYLLMGSWPRLLELAYWPSVQIILWGFISKYFVSQTSWAGSAAGALLAAVLLWDILFRGQLGYTISFMEELWSRNLQTDYGKFGLNWGYASSPLLRDDGLYVQVLHGMKTDDPSYVMKIDRTTGKTIWRVERPTPAVHESPDSYTTPAWVEANGRAELIITGGDVVSGHDPATGKEYWRADVLNPNRNGAYRIVASPTIVDGLIIAPTRNNPMVAVRPGGAGDVAATHVVWAFPQGPDVPTPVSDGKLLYVVRDGGVVFALDVKTGARVYGPVRLPSGTYSASPILADGKIYVTTEEDGVTTVFRAGPEFEILASNKLLGDCSPYCLSTVAVSEGQIFLRTSSYLWAIGERKASK